ncbi:MAG: hypothetical protein LAQ69_20910 [Acidobacteriia bacterium]|nr:hypothetical protein [Terriglobia bacterium]
MATARLPGIYFESVAPPAPGPLPRMDIAAFAGFLPSGPIGLPFVVEDPGRFQEIFGVDLPLAWDRERNQMRLALTPPAVRDFFRNGGTRCWVARLANGAQSNAWVVPGLLQVDGFGGLHAGWVQARSEGSWSDGLTVNATLLESPLAAGALVTTGPSPEVSGLSPGDVVQLYFRSTGTIAFHSATDPRWFWFRQAAAAEFGACDTASPPQAPPDSVAMLGPGSDVAVAFSGFCRQGSELVLHVTRDAALSIPPGCWLRMQFGSKTLLYQVESVEAGPDAPGSPASGESAALTSTLAWWVLDPNVAWLANRGTTVQISVVTFELFASPQGAPVQRLADLGLAPENPRYWGYLPPDAVLYAPTERPAPVAYAALATDIDHPRFDLAGGLPAGLGIPLGMTALTRSDFDQGASLPGGTALERDGLATFNQDLFIDPHLAGSKAATLLQDAFFYQYQAQPPSPPTGLYSLLGVDEASLLAVPDATHTGWRKATAQTALLAAPDPLQVSPPDAGGNYTVSWGAVAGASGYRLQESGDPLFVTGVTSRDVGAGVSVALTNNPQCPLVLYYRASAYGLPGVSPWSVTKAVELGNASFFVCSEQPLEAPALQIFEDRNRIILEWTPAPGGADGFTLQTAADPQFESGHVLFTGLKTSFEYWRVPGPSTYFRVNTQRGGASSAWSDTVNTTPEPVTPFEVIPQAAAGPPVLLERVHSAMLRMASARADMLAVLSLPLPYRRDESLAYRESLAQLLANEDTSGRMMSYAALYHPWTVIRDNTQPLPFSLRTVPPDGAVSGVIAAKALAQGAWIAPANVALESAVALDPALQANAALAFAGEQINLIAQQPEGFLVTDQDTLITDAELQPINVRRLLILLRRLALREGVRYVFQNISPAFVRAVTRQFEQWMQQLLARGAFAGKAAQDSYRVVTDASVNPQDSIDQGRFVVELLVAPARPMRFLTVRLVQSGGNLTLEEG